MREQPDGTRALGRLCLVHLPRREGIKSLDLGRPEGAGRAVEAQEFVARRKGQGDWLRLPGTLAGNILGGGMGGDDCYGLRVASFPDATDRCRNAVTVQSLDHASAPFRPEDSTPCTSTGNAIRIDL